jgi:phage portal protein BeeE
VRIRPDAIEFDSGTMYLGADEQNGYRRIPFDAEGRLPDIGGVQWRALQIRNPHGVTTDSGATLGVFAMHPSTFALADRMQAYALGTYRTGVPAGYLKQTGPALTQAQADELKRKWLEAHGGDRRSIAVLNSTVDFHAIEYSPIDTALVDMGKAQLGEVAHAFNLDGAMLGAPTGDSGTYANIESRFSLYRTGTLGRWQADTEQAVSALLPYGTDLDIRLDLILRANPTARYEAHASALGAGWKTPNEVRAEEGLPPVDGGDELITAAAPAPDPEPEPEPDTEGGGTDEQP